MGVTLQFILTSLSLCCGFFTLGACAVLYLQYSTRILRLIVLFIVSLVIIGFGFWVSSFSMLNSTDLNSSLEIVLWIIQVCGVVLNVVVLPFLVSAVTFSQIGKRMKVFLTVWDTILVSCAVLFPFLPDPFAILAIVHVQLVVTIAGSIAAILINMGTITRKDMRRSLTGFLVISALFLLLLTTDILISKFRVEFLSAFDNLSLPVYLISLQIGSFYFAGTFLSSGPLLVKDRITEHCVDNYGLTNREREIIEALIQGKTNQELADMLFISKKTVENHLYNIYQKMHVKNRMHLVQTLKNWGKES